MKIIIIDTLYSDFLVWFYKHHPDVAGLDYPAHVRRMMDCRFGTSDAYSFYLKACGHEAKEIIANDSVLLKKWARERGLRIKPWPDFLTYTCNYFFDRDWRFEVLKAQIEEEKPDLIYIQEQSILTDRAVEWLKGKDRFVIAQIGTPLLKKRSYRAVDLVLSPAPRLVEACRARGLEAGHFRLGFDARISQGLGEVSKDTEVLFVGGISPAHRRRIEILERICAKFPLVWYGYGEKELSPRSALRRAWRGWVCGWDMYRRLAASWITLNNHIDFAGDFAGNMRMFEATGVGSCLLTDWKKNISDFYEPEKEVVTYRDPDEVIEKIGYYLGHKDECRRIAEAGQKRTLTEHSYENRMKELSRIIDTRFGGKNNFPGLVDRDRSGWGLLGGGV